MQALKEKEINFLDAAKRREKKRSGRKIRTVIQILVPGVLFLAMAGVSLYFGGSADRMKKEAKQIQREMDQDSVRRQEQELAALDSENRKYAEFKDNFENLKKELERGEEPDSGAIRFVTEACGGRARLEELSYGDGCLYLSCSVSRVEEAAAYVQRLEEKGIFTEVIYTGYEKDQEIFRFDVICRLLQAGGGEDETVKT